MRKYVGAYAAAMGGTDALVFTAGIARGLVIQTDEERVIVEDTLALNGMARAGR